MTTSRSRRLARRGAGSLAIVALAAGTLGAVPAQAAPGDPDPAPVAAGADWLAAQVPESGIYQTYYEYMGTEDNYPDYGVTIDAATSLTAVGGHADDVTTMTDAILENADAYVTSFGTTYANSAAKIAAFALAQGRSGDVVDGLVDTVVGSVAPDAPIAGRIEDDPTDFGDFASPIGQAYAVAALAAAGEVTVRDSVEAYLLGQQCQEGYLRETFTADKTAADQTCDGAPDDEQDPSIDTTAFAVLTLQEAAEDDPELAAFVDRAQQWLGTQQDADGSFAGNANSTGLAGQALGVSGRTGKARLAATWLRQHQLANAGSCQPFAADDTGALTVDDLGFANAGDGPLGLVDDSVAFRATAQALPALQYADGGANAGRTQLRTEEPFVKAGSTTTVSVVGAPANTLCAKPGRGEKELLVLAGSGQGTIEVTLPAQQAKVLVSTVDAAGRTAKTTIQGLAPKTLSLDADKRLVRGDKTRVKVTGLAAREPVRIRLRGDDVVTGKAGRGGNFVARFEVKKRTGRTNLIVLGAFGTRKGVQPVTITR